MLSTSSAARRGGKSAATMLLLPRRGTAPRGIAGGSAGVGGGGGVGNAAPAAAVLPAPGRELSAAAPVARPPSMLNAPTAPTVPSPPPAISLIGGGGGGGLQWRRQLPRPATSSSSSRFLSTAPAVDEDNSVHEGEGEEDAAAVGGEEVKEATRGKGGKKGKGGKEKKRRSINDASAKDPIVVTDRAAERVLELLAGETAKGAVGIRLGVRRRGCNGLSYTLNYAYPDEAKHRNDVEMVAPRGVRVYIEPMALFSVVGTTMDWEETELASEFTFKNPNSKGECGCGESFTV